MVHTHPKEEGLRGIGTMQGVDMLWVVIQLQIGVTASFSFCLFSFQLRRRSRYLRITVFSPRSDLKIVHFVAMLEDSDIDSYEYC